jgi:hypothetical protein
MSDCHQARNGAEKVRHLQRALYRTSKQDKSRLYAMGLVYVGSGRLEYVAKPVHGGR